MRAHGQIGAFVSRWRIDAKTLEVEEGSDLIQPPVRYWNYVTQQHQDTPSPAGDNPRTFGSEQPNVTKDDFVAQPAPLGRFCSGTLTTLGQLYNARTGRGYFGRMYFPNEETGIEGRAFGTLVDGTTEQLPRLGLFSWENVMPAANRSDTTLVMGTEDTPHGQLRAYVGAKTRRGDAFDRAGLTNGVNHVIDLVDETVERRGRLPANVRRGRAGRVRPRRGRLGSVGRGAGRRGGGRGPDAEPPRGRRLGPAQPVGLLLHDDRRRRHDAARARRAASATQAASGGCRSRTSSGRSCGGTLTLLLDGVGGEEDEILLNSPDNLGMDRRGNLLIQEDNGNNRERGRIIAYQVHTGELGIVAQFDAELFSFPNPVMTLNEESSGIIDAREVLGRGWWLFDAQVHRPVADPARVTEGQLMAMRIKRWDDVYRYVGPPPHFLLRVRSRRRGSERDHVHPVRAGLDAASDLGVDPDGVPLADLDDVVLELEAAAAGDDHVDLLLRLVAVAERHPLVRA